MDATITIRTRKAVKLAAQKRAKALGLSLSDVINNQLRRFAKGDDVVYDSYLEYTDEQIADLIEAGREADELYEKIKRGEERAYTGDEFIQHLDDIISGKIKVNDDGTIDGE